MPELPGEIIENRTVEAGGEEKTEWNSAASGDVSTIDQHIPANYSAPPFAWGRGLCCIVATQPAFVERVYAAWNLLQLKALLAFMGLRSHPLVVGGDKSMRVLRMASH
jgi:hypothetical protein